MTREELLQRHDELSASIAGQQRGLANLLPQEREVKVNTFLAASGTDTVRRNAADQASLHVTTQVLRIKSEIDALMIELENVRLQLHYT